VWQEKRYSPPDSNIEVHQLVYEDPDRKIRYHLNQKILQILKHLSIGKPLIREVTFNNRYNYLWILNKNAKDYVKEELILAIERDGFIKMNGTKFKLTSFGRKLTDSSEFKEIAKMLPKLK